MHALVQEGKGRRVAHDYPGGHLVGGVGEDVGDVRLEDVVEAFRRWDVDGVMIARASLGRPWLFQQAAAALVLPFLAVDPLVGNTFNITAFVIVVLGGMGSIPGALLGGLIIGLTQEMGVVFFPSSTKLMGVFIVFILVLMFRPQGLLGRKA